MASQNEDKEAVLDSEFAEHAGKCLGFSDGVAGGTGEASQGATGGRRGRHRMDNGSRNG